MNNEFSKEEIEKMLKNSTEEIVVEDENIIDEFGNMHNINQITEQAEASVKKKYPKVNFRWSEFEIARAKKLQANLVCHIKLILSLCSNKVWIMMKIG